MTRLDRVLELVRSEVPGLRIVDKSTVWWMRAAGRILRPMIPDFESRYTTVIGDTVYLPQPMDSMPPDALASTLLHELIHQRDQAAWGVLFYLSYGLTPLPLGRSHRAHWERRAYAVDLMLAHHIGGEPHLRRVEARICHLFSGAGYGWMWAGEGAAEAFLAPVVEPILAGTLQRVDPYDRILRAWVGPTSTG